MAGRETKRQAVAAGPVVLTSPRLECQKCGKASEEMKWCIGCHSVWYCSPTHEAEDKENHRSACHAWQNRQKENRLWPQPALVLIASFCTALDYSAMCQVSMRFSLYCKYPLASPAIVACMGYLVTRSHRRDAGYWRRLGDDPHDSLVTRLAPREVHTTWAQLNAARFSAALKTNTGLLSLECMILKPNIPHMMYLKVGSLPEYRELFNALASLPRLRVLHLPIWNTALLDTEMFPVLEEVRVHAIAETFTRCMFPLTLKHLSSTHILCESGPRPLLMRLAEQTALVSLAMHGPSVSRHPLAVVALLESCKQLKSLGLTSLFVDESDSDDDVDENGEEKEVEEEAGSDTDDEEKSKARALTVRRRKQRINDRITAALVSHPALHHLDVYCTCSTRRSRERRIGAVLAQRHQLDSLCVMCCSCEPCTRVLHYVPGLADRLVHYESTRCWLSIKPQGYTMPIVGQFKMPSLTSLSVHANLMSAKHMDPVEFAPLLSTLRLKGDIRISDAGVLWTHMSKRPLLKHFTSNTEMVNPGRVEAFQLPFPVSQLETLDDVVVEVRHDSEDDTCFRLLHRMKQLRTLTLYIRFADHVLKVDETPAADSGGICACGSIINMFMKNGWLSHENMPHLHTLRMLPWHIPGVALVPVLWSEWVQTWRNTYLRHITHFNEY